MEFDWYNMLSGCQAFGSASTTVAHFWRPQERSRGGSFRFPCGWCGRCLSGWKNGLVLQDLLVIIMQSSSRLIYVWINCKCDTIWKLDRNNVLGIVISDYNCQQQDRTGWEGEKKIRASEKQTRGCAFSTFCSNSFANFSSSVSVSICMAPLVTSTFTRIPLSNGGSGGSRGGCSWVGYSSASSFGSGFRAWNNLEPNWPCHFGGNHTSGPTYPKTTSHPNGVERDRELVIQDLL